SFVFFCNDEISQFFSEKINIINAGTSTDRKRDVFLHRFTSRNIFDPNTIVDDVRNLDITISIDTPEYGIQEGDVLHHHIDTVDFNSISNIIWMLDEKEDTGTSEFLNRTSKCEREGH